WIKKYRFHIKNDEHQRVQIVAHVKADLAAADGFVAAFINHGFARRGLVRTKQLANGQNDNREHDTQDEENRDDHVRVNVLVHDNPPLSRGVETAALPLGGGSNFLPN